MSEKEPKQADRQRLSVLSKSYDGSRVFKITAIVMPRQHLAKFESSPKTCRPRSWLTARQRPGVGIGLPSDGRPLSPNGTYFDISATGGLTQVIEGKRRWQTSDR